MRAARDLVDSKYAIALTGAGISTESGIPDFRGPSGVWTRNPQAEKLAYRSYDEFVKDPRQWWRDRLASPGVLGDLERCQPNAGHIALTELEHLGKLRWVVTQNVDGLHEKAGTKNLLEYHGSYFKLRCMCCGLRLRHDEIDLARLAREDRLPPRCPKCRGTLKTDTVSFGEPIPTDVAQRSLDEALKCDLMLICGTSAVVYPFASLPRLARQRRDIRIIEINAEPTPLTQEAVSDYFIQGKTGIVLPRIVLEIKRLMSY